MIVGVVADAAAEAKKEYPLHEKGCQYLIWQPFVLKQIIKGTSKNQISRGDKIFKTGVYSK